jgi:putative transposase
MPEYREGTHMIYKIKYHLVGVTKYRYEVLKEKLRFRPAILSVMSA